MPRARPVWKGPGERPATDAVGTSSSAMTLKLQGYLDLLKRPPEIPSFEPEIDDLDEKKDKELRCEQRDQLTVILDTA